MGPSVWEPLGGLLGRYDFRQVTKVDGYKAAITDAGLVHLETFPQLTDVAFGGEARITDAGLISLRGLVTLEKLDIRGTAISDAGLASLQGLTHLKALTVLNRKRTDAVTNAGLANLGGLTELVYLNLSGTSVTDAGLVSLHGMTKLQRLDLSGTQITDAAIPDLRELTSLRQVNVGGTWVTPAGVEAIEAAIRANIMRNVDLRTQARFYIEFERKFPKDAAEFFEKHPDLR